MAHLLFSTNTWLKFHIQERYRNQLHHVWCSDCFDGRKLSAYTSGSLLPPSANPADIYNQLTADVKASDRHSPKIASQKLVLMALAANWESSGAISDVQAKEIVFMVNNATFNEWRPLLYVFPSAIVAGRVRAVPMSERASFADEFIVEDLRRDEFDLVEL